jgi:CheY-like chemotaxis protein
LAGEKVLVIEDKPEMIQILTDYVLDPQGYVTLTALGGEEGLRMALTEEPDLVILDLRMPQMSGLQVLQSLRERQYPVPVIVITAYGSEEVVVRALRLGANDYVAKPFELDEMLTVIERVLSKSKAEKALRDRQAARTRQAIERKFNPYKAGGPVEVKMFFGRDEALAAVLDTIHNNHIAIYGERRIGKTSLLHQLDNRLRALEDPQYFFIPVFVNLQGMPAERLFYTLMSAIARSCQPRVGPLNLIHATKREGYDAYDLVDDLEMVLEALEATTDRQIRLVLLLDEGDELNKYDPKVQARLRGVFMTRAGRYLRMVWSGLSIDKEWKLDTSPWYNLFAIEIRLTPFTREEAFRLIQEPVKGIYRYEKDAIELILQHSECKPFRVQQICLATINHVLAQKWRRMTGPIRVTKEDVEKAYRGLAVEEATSREVEERGKVGLLEKQVAEDRAEYQVNTDGQGDQ